MNEIVIKRPGLSIKFEITKESNFNFYHGNLYINGKLMDTVHAVLNTKYQDLTIQDFPFKLYNEIKDRLPYYIEYTASEDYGVYFEIKDIENVQIVDPKGLLNEITVKPPSPFRFEVTKKGNQLQTGNFYFGSTLLDDDAVFYKDAKLFSIGIPKEIYNDIENQLPSHEISSGRIWSDGFAGVKETWVVMIKDISNIRIVDNIDEIVVNRPAPFKFKVTKIENGMVFGEFYINNKLVDPNNEFYASIKDEYITFFIPANEPDYEELKQQVEDSNLDIVYKNERDNLYMFYKIKTSNVNIVGNIDEIKIGRPTSLKFEITPQRITKSGEMLLKNEFFGNLYYHDELLDNEAFLSLAKTVVTVISKEVLDKIKDQLPPFEIQDIFDDNSLIEVWFNGKDVKIVDPTGQSLNEIKVNAPRPFVFDGYYYDENDNSTEGELYFNGELLDSDAVYTYAAYEGGRVWYIAFSLDTPTYGRLFDSLSPYVMNRIIGGSSKRTLAQITDYPDNYQHTIIIKDLSKVNLKNLPPFVNEIVIRKPGKPFQFKIDSYNGSNESYDGEFYFHGELLDDIAIYYPEKRNGVLAGYARWQQYIIFEVPSSISKKLHQMLLDNGALVIRADVVLVFYGIKGLDKVEIVDKKGLFSEIKIGVPGWKNFVINKNISRMGVDDFWLALTHPELRSPHYVSWHKGNDYVMWVWSFYDEKDIDEKNRLLDLLSKYDKKVEIVPEFGIIKIPLSLIDQTFFTQLVNEIRVGVPNKVFKFKSRASLGDGLFMGDLYFKNKIIDSNAFHNKKSIARTLSFFLPESVYKSLEDEIDPYVINVGKDREYDENEIGLVFIIDDINSVLFMDDNINEIKISTPNWKNIEAEMVDQDNDIEIFEFMHPESDMVWYGHRELGSDVFNIEFGDADERAHEEYAAEILTNLLSKYNKSYKRINIDDEMFWIQIPKNIVTIFDEDVNEIKVSTPGWKNFTLNSTSILDVDENNIPTYAVTLKHPELKLHYFGYWDKNKDYVIWPFDDFDEENGFKTQLTNLLDKYSRPYKVVNDAGPDEDFDDSYIKIPLSIINVSVNEIAMSDLKKVEAEGGKVVDSSKIGIYTLDLVKFDWGYTISLTSNDKEYLVPQGMDKIPTSSSIKDVLPVMRQFVSQIKKWIAKYQEIYIGSANEEKARFYYKLFDKEFEKDKNYRIQTKIVNNGTDEYTKTDSWGFWMEFVKNRNINEITINKPKTKFEFPLIVNDQEQYDFYDAELKKAGKRWYVNYDGTFDDISSVSWPNIGPNEDKFPFCIKTNYYNPEVLHALPYNECKKLYDSIDEIEVKPPHTKIPLKFKKIITDYTGWRDGVMYSVDIEGFPETSVTIHDDEPNVVYLYPGQYIGDIKTKLDMLSVPYESLVNNILVDKKYFSNYEIN